MWWMARGAYFAALLVMVVFVSKLHKLFAYVDSNRIVLFKITDRQHFNAFAIFTPSDIHVHW